MLCLLLGWGLITAPGIRAQSLDDIEVAGAGGESRITVRFATQVRYQRHVVDNSSQSVQIFLQVTGASEDDGVFEDTRNSPPGHDLPGFEDEFLEF